MAGLRDTLALEAVIRWPTPESQLTVTNCEGQMRTLRQRRHLVKVPATDCGRLNQGV